MRVLLLPSWFPTAERPLVGPYFRDQARAMQLAGVETSVLFVEQRSLRGFGLRALGESHFQTTEGMEQGVPVVRIKGWNPLMQTTAGGLVWARLSARAVERYVASHGRPDLIHAHASLWAGEAARIVARRSGIPFVVTEHGSAFADGTVTPSALRRALGVFAAARATVAVSAALGRRLVERGARAPIETIPNSVDLDFWSLPSIPRRAAPFTFFALGHLIPRKRVDLLLRAFAARFRGGEARLLIGGDGPEREMLESLATSLGIVGQVTFLGALSREAARQQMWEADGFVLCSVAETFGVVVIEALSTGLPVVATRSGGPEEILTPEVGALIPPDDLQALGDAMVAMVARAPTFDPLAARGLAERGYGHAAIGARHAVLYRRCLEAAR